MKVNTSKLIMFITVLGLIAVYFNFDLGRYFTLSSIKEKHKIFIDFYADNQIVSVSVFLGAYILITALSLPGASVMTVAAGSMFGLFLGTVLVSVASTTGATLSFLLSRFIFRETVQKRFGEKLETVNEGIAKEGVLYLFSLRLVPVFPFFLINLLMGLTLIKTPVYIFVSQIGMLPGTIVFVNAGTQLSKIESLGGILSPGILISFILIGTFPLFAKKAVNLLQKRY